jgi:hexosaminidase
VRELVEYARVRNVTIVPEIELPGHVASAIAAYPGLGCSRQPQLPLTGGDYAGITSNYCAGNDSVFVFLKDVLNEVMDVFPSEYIHIGGDEVDKGPWKKCPRCQARMKREGLKNEEELQSWFIRKVEGIVNARGRRMIGWDEILEGGLAPTATVMSWRGEAGGIEAARMGHDVIMTPGNPCYFDHYQAGPEGEPPAFGGMNTLRKVYDYEPVPEELRGESSKHVLGAQGNVWTEHITTAEHLEYMILPRMPALAEVLWSPASTRDWMDFNRRLKSHFKAFDQLGFRYGKGNFKVEVKPVPVDGVVSVELSTEAMASEIRYTLDGSEPTVTAKRYEGPFAIDRSSTLRAVTVVDGAAKSHQLAEQSFVFHKATGATLSFTQPPAKQYMASGPSALVDAIRGTQAVGRHWQGFEGKDLVAMLDLGKPTEVRRVSVGCLQRYTDWIFFPASLTVEGSADGRSYRSLGTVAVGESQQDRTPMIRAFAVDIRPETVRYLRVTAARIPGCPKGHPGEGKPAWIFADEIVVE